MWRSFDRSLFMDTQVGAGDGGLSRRTCLSHKIAPMIYYRHLHPIYDLRFLKRGSWKGNVAASDPISFGSTLARVDRCSKRAAEVKVSIFSYISISGATVVQEVEKTFRNQKVASSIPC